MADASYAWIIDTDHLDPDPTEQGSDAGRMGPRDASADLLGRLANTTEGFVFQMRDDDDELYYTGRILFTDSDEIAWNSEHAMAPLDDFGAPNAGCTDIEYWKPTLRSVPDSGEPMDPDTLFEWVTI